MLLRRKEGARAVPHLEEDPWATKDDAHREAESFFEEHWRKGDAWAFDSSPWERPGSTTCATWSRIDATGGVLEMGCGAGHFTERLLPLADSVLALDISATAIEKARRVSRDPSPPSHVDLRVANVMEADLRAEGTLRPRGPHGDRVLPGLALFLLQGGLAGPRPLRGHAPGGRLLLANTLGEIGDALVLPWIVRGYHDVFRNAGYEHRARREPAGAIRTAWSLRCWFRSSGVLDHAQGRDVVPAATG